MKKALALMCIFTMLLLLVACGTSDTDTSSVDIPTTEYSAKADDSANSNSYPSKSSSPTHTNELNGVPDSVILYDLNISLDFYQDYTIVHDINTESHIDTATIFLYSESEYAKISTSIVARYQYNRASDIWALLDKSDSSSDTEFTDAILGEWEFRCTDCDWHDPFYILIHIQEIDMTNRTIVFTATGYCGDQQIMYEVPTHAELYVQDYRGSYGFHILSSSWGNDGISVALGLFGVMDSYTYYDTFIAY